MASAATSLKHWGWFARLLATVLVSNNNGAYDCKWTSNKDNVWEANDNWSQEVRFACLSANKGAIRVLCKVCYYSNRSLGSITGCREVKSIGCVFGTQTPCICIWDYRGERGLEMDFRRACSNDQLWGTVDCPLSVIGVVTCTQKPASKHTHRDNAWEEAYWAFLFCFLYAVCPLTIIPSLSTLLNRKCPAVWEEGPPSSWDGPWLIYSVFNNAFKLPQALRDQQCRSLHAYMNVQVPSAEHSIALLPPT